jgi:hypothetical protein
LGIHNSPHYQDVIKINDAIVSIDAHVCNAFTARTHAHTCTQALQRRLAQLDKQSQWRGDEEEEYEDHDGNVYNRKTYEDLVRQGLLK